MKDYESNNMRVPDFSSLIRAAKILEEAVRPAVEMANRVKEVMRPIAEIASKYQPNIEKLRSNMEIVVKGVAEASHRIMAIDKLGDVQFVYWDFMTAEFVEAINESNNVNKTLREFIIKDKFKLVNDTIIKCETNPILKRQLRLYNQAVEAFRLGHNDLAVNGLMSVFDGLLSDVSDNCTHQLKPRIDVIKKKLENNELLDNDEYATLTFACTFEKTVDSYIATAPFDKKEPKGLNRHWIAHGRSTRRKTKLDCIKMINLIYGLLLISELDEKAVIKLTVV